MTPKNPRPPDLTPAEAATQRWFDALPRAVAPHFEPAHFGPAHFGPAHFGPDMALGAARPAHRPLFGAWFRPVAAAAAVLLALAVPAHTTATPPARGGGAAYAGAGTFHSAQFEVAVVDDPSVPMLHALETFDQLACLTDPSGLGLPGSGATGAGGR